MIAVIADDFTGAAEIGGIGLRYGYKVVLDTSYTGGYDANLLIFATNMRAMEEEEAMKVLEELLQQLKKIQLTGIYFKLDSVFRGHVKRTLFKAQEILDCSNVLFIPANPSINRIIENGVYYYQDKPLMASGFFSSTVKNKSSSSVLDLIKKKDRDPIFVSSPTKELEHGITVGNAESIAQIDEWADLLKPECIPAGGANFFEAILKRKYCKSEGRIKKNPIQTKRLYISGSAHQNSRNTIRKAKENKAIIHFMPEDIFGKNGRNQFEEWEASIVSDLNVHDMVIAAIGELKVQGVENVAIQIESLFAKLAGSILEKTEIDELIIEGGATAYAIISQLRYGKFNPVQELAPGVIRMKIKDHNKPVITVKPGSYKWSEEIWPF